MGARVWEFKTYFVDCTECGWSPSPEITDKEEAMNLARAHNKEKHSG